MRADLAQVGGLFRHLWTCTGFASAELRSYAEAIMLTETRRGLVALSLISLVLMSAMAIVYTSLDAARYWVYTYGLLGALSLHVFLSARKVDDLRALHMLGVTLLVLCGCAIVLLAHQARTFSPGLFATVLLLFMAVPMIPWGLREAGLVATLIYLVFTVSTLSRASRFATETLVILQFYMIASWVISMVVVMRMVGVRKDDIAARFALEESHRQMEELSYRDPLTGAWNRRYLTDKFAGVCLRLGEQGLPSWFVLFDVDRFKQINDGYGHDYGDQVLQRIVDAFAGVVHQDELIVRLGGDEFALLLAGPHPGERLAPAVGELRANMAPNGRPGAIRLSMGMISIAPHEVIDLESAYRRADMVAYAAKKSGGDRLWEQHGVGQ